MACVLKRKKSPQILSTDLPKTEFAFYGKRFLHFGRNDKNRSLDMTNRLFAKLDVYRDHAAHSAAMNMATDEALLEHATAPSIRFYRWHSPALSFGYFGKFSDVAVCAAERELVRRWTGGGIVFHGG